MNEHDPLTEQIVRLSQNAPSADFDPFDDIQRGQKALRRRRVRGLAGVAAVAILLAGAGAAANYVTDQPDNTARSETTERPDLRFAANTPSVLCITQLSESDRLSQLGPSPSAGDRRSAAGAPPWQHPSIATDLVNYRKTAQKVLDPSGQHLDAAVTNVQYGCNPSNGQLATLGTRLGWTTAGAHGLVTIDVATRDYDKEPSEQGSQLHTGLPDNVTYASTKQTDNGQIVFVKRSDGLTVTVSTNDTWANSDSPVPDLPSVSSLVELAASPGLTFPSHGES